MNSNYCRRGENCHECNYDRRCTEKDEMLAAIHRLNEKEMEEFMQAHPNAGKIRKLIFMLFMV